MLRGWEKELCSNHFYFVGGFQHTGTGLLRATVGAHPLLRYHNGTGKVQDEGGHLQSVFPNDAKREAKCTEVCGCREDLCWYYCPQLQDTIVDYSTRYRLYKDWFTSKSWMLETGFALEKSPDFLALMRSRFFPYVSTHIILIRHPLCLKYEFYRREDIPRPLESLTAWLRAWRDLIKRQMPLLTGQLMVVRFEDLLRDPQGSACELWRLMGLLPVPDDKRSSYPLAARAAEELVHRCSLAHAATMSKDGAAGLQGQEKEMMGRRQRQRRLNYHPEINATVYSEAKVQNLMWGRRNCIAFDHCAGDRACLALWVKARAVTNHFGYSLGVRRVAYEPHVFVKEHLQPLHLVDWGV